MGKIVPRWEWRTFAPELGAAESALAAVAWEGAQESDEVYFLSPACDANVKVRGGLMDIKLLEQVDAAGLERWRPVMKGAFPLAAEDAKRVFAALAVTPPSTARAAYSQAELEDELGAPGRGVRVVTVHKRRVRSTLRGCMAEMTDVVAGGAKARTVALEAEDAGRVLDAVRGIGLTALPNTSYPRGLKRLIGMKR